MLRRLMTLVASLAFVAAMTPMAEAQNDTGQIEIVVQDASTKAPIVLARVLLDGPVVTSEFTGNDGKVLFTDVPDGIYRARVFGRGFQAVTSANFEVLNGRAVTITVALAQSTNGPLKTIASVVAKSTATISTTSISAQSAQRKLSDTLADALGKLSGVTVTTSSTDSDATQTVSLEGQDASQTAMTVDGIPLNAPGTAGDLRGINSDLFSGANVSFGPQIGGSAGSVNFSTISPTLSWQSEFSLSVGSNGKNNYSAAESGTLGKVSLALMHTYRAVPSLLDGMNYLDTSGLDYMHEGDRNATGSMLKLRYQLNDAQTLTGTLLHSTNAADLVCAQFTGPLPCGYGPGNYNNTRFDLYSIMDNALVGDTQIQASYFGMRMSSLNDLLDRYVNGIAAPTGTRSSNSNNGFMVNATLPAKQRHTLSIMAFDENSESTFTPLVAQAAAYTFPGQRASYAAISINDSMRSNAKLRFNDSLGISHATNAPSTLLLGFSTNWQPTTSDSYAFQYNIGGVAPHAGRAGVLTDPAQLRIDCTGDIAYGNAPGDEPGASSSTSARLSYTHRLNGGLISAQVYRTSQNGIVLPVNVNGAQLVNSGIFPPNYFAIANQTLVNDCGAPAVPAFGPQDTYFSMPIGGVQRVYEGFHLVGFFTLMRNLVVEPSYDTQVAVANSTDPRFANPYAITISGAQLPNIPLHRGALVLDYKAPHSNVEWLADANYTSGNNWQNLPAYTTADAGVDIQTQRGSFTFAISNIFNTYSGLFATSQGAVPYRTANGVLIPTISHPNPPRQLSFTYTARFGQNAQQSNVTTAPTIAGDRGGPNGRFRRGAFFNAPLPQAPPSDPFAMNVTPICTADAQKAALPIMNALKAYVAQVNAAKSAAGTYPATMGAPVIPGIAVEYHGLKTTYALTLTLKQPSLMRSLFGCTQFHVADLQTAQQRSLYIPPAAGGGMFFRPSVTFMPSVGLYFVRQPPQAGQESFRLYKLPSAPPVAPFQLHAPSTLCTADLHALAQRSLAALQSHFVTGSPAEGWTITPHIAKSGTYYTLEPDDIGMVPAILNCGHVASAAKDDLAKVGWDGSPPPALNYAPPLGLYLTLRRPAQGRPAGAGAQGGNGRP